MKQASLLMCIIPVLDLHRTQNFLVLYINITHHFSVLHIHIIHYCPPPTPPRAKGLFIEKWQRRKRQQQQAGRQKVAILILMRRCHVSMNRPSALGGFGTSRGNGKMLVISGACHKIGVKYILYINIVYTVCICVVYTSIYMYTHTYWCLCN